MTCFLKHNVSWLEGRFGIVEPTDSPYSIERVSLPDDLPLGFELIAQFFLAPYIMKNSSNARLNIPIGSQSAWEKVIQEILPHFQEHVAFSTENGVFHVTCHTPNHRSVQRFINLQNTNELHPIIRDLYRVECTADFAIHQNMDLYQVQKECVEAQSAEGFEVFWDFMKSTFVGIENSLTVSPTGWILSDELLQSEFLKSLCAVCDEVYLLVNDAGHVQFVVGGLLKEQM